MKIKGGVDAAIRALGSLFKLTEVYIWDDGSMETREISLLPESTKSSSDLNDISFNIPASTTGKDYFLEFSEILENEELTKQMDALGLPISFLSNKKTSNKTKKNKRKGARLKHSCCHKEAKEEIVSTSVLNDSTSNSLCCMSMMGQSESCFMISTKIISGAVGEKSLGGTSHCMSNDGHEYESVPHNDVMSKDDGYGGQSLSNSDCAPPPVCCLTNAGADHGEKRVDSRLMGYECLEDSSATNHHEEGDKFCNDSGTEHMRISESAELSQSSEVIEHGEIDSYNYSGDFGDWRVYWDSFYMRYYFHNIKTDTCTWYPPPGMEHLASGDITDELNEAIAEVTEMDGGSSFSCGSLNYHETSEGPPNDESCVNQSSDEVLMEIGVATGNSLPGLTILPANGSFEHADECLVNGSCDVEVASHLPSAVQERMNSLTTTVPEEVTEESDIYLEIADPANDNLISGLALLSENRKRKRRKHDSIRNHQWRVKVYTFPILACERTILYSLQSEQMFQEFSSNIGKYWCQRYTLFSRFDDGIRMDEEGWFSVTPESLAKHHALRCTGDTVIDCFTGVGGNTIQFAQRCKHVIAIDIDPKKIDYAFHNASIYGVNDQIDFIQGDFFALASKLKADTVFLSPPWGGPAYSKVTTYDIKTMLKPRDGYFLFNTAKQIGRRIIMFLPRNIDLNQLAELCLTSNPPWSLEVEKNFMNGKLKAITAYFSNVVTEGR
ncbi:trimethylguanosine synthase [Salix suchowensis]|nr:trimethylguanosine synthase [Salix suchowensis]